MFVRHFTRTCLLVGALSLAPCIAPAQEQTTPAEQQILSNVFHYYCIICHGKLEREAGLDLRTRASMLKGGKSGPALVPGSPEKSLVYTRLVADEMPPKTNLFGNSKYVRRVRANDIKRLRQWIAAGAPAAAPENILRVGNGEDALVTAKARKFWSLQPPERPPLPEVSRKDLVRTPIDAFLLEKLEEKGLSFAPEQEHLALMRRAYFAVTGLPPGQDEIEAYLADKPPDAYERLVKKLLDSPHFGERWGAFWLDAVGYADTHCKVNRDEFRPWAWRYRDYVIRSLNDDKPYDRFLVEQIAGDELFDFRSTDTLTREQIDCLVATGFLRTAADDTDETGFNFAEYRMAVVNDQVQIFSSAVLGLTMDCARCHTHKFDPIPQRDYYRLAAIFRSAFDPYDWRIPSAVIYPPPATPVPEQYQRLITHSGDVSPALGRHNQRITTNITRLKGELAKVGTALVTKLRSERLLASAELVAHYRFDEGAGTAVTNAVNGKTEGRTNAKFSTDVAPIVDNAFSLDFTQGGSVTITERPFALQRASGEKGQNATLEFFVKCVNAERKPGSIFWTTTEEADENRFNFQIMAVTDEVVKLSADYIGPKGEGPFGLAGKGKSLPVDRWVHVAIVQSAVEDGYRYEWYFDGKLDTDQTTAYTTPLPTTLAWTIGGRPGLPLRALVDDVRLWRGAVGPAQFSRGSNGGPEPKYLVKLCEQALSSLGEERAALRGELESIHSEIERAGAKIESLEKRLLSELKIYGLYDIGGEPTPVHVLNRGDWRSPTKRVLPGVPTAIRDGIEPFSAKKPSWDTSGLRLGLARWLTQPNHPLTARVMVNRIWQHHFGKGIVATPGNFGETGLRPSHPKLLDWLATEFVRLGWSQKELHRQILTSTVYRQHSLVDADRYQKDPDNTLLSRFPFRRLEAEAIRDSVLKVAGRLDLTPFGPADDVTVAGNDEVRVDETESGLRRSVYVVRRRKTPVTMLELFDAPRVMLNCLRRPHSTVAPQALQLWNSTMVRSNARLFAKRVLDATGKSVSEQIRRVYLEALSRPPSSEELEIGEAAVLDLRQHWSNYFEQQGVSENSILEALATYCHTILNSPEFLYVD